MEHDGVIVVPHRGIPDRRERVTPETFSSRMELGTLAL
jgi:hypothetical protein